MVFFIPIYRDVVVVAEERQGNPDAVKAIVWVERYIILKRHEDKTQLLKNKLFHVLILVFWSHMPACQQAGNRYKNFRSRELNLPENF